MPKKRLDVLLVERGYFESREKAQAAILAGVVYIGGSRGVKPGDTIDADVEIAIQDNPNPYVSRGGLKLEKALQVFEIDLSGKVCLDIGASTGGFTDCMLQNGAAKVVAVDVGYGQLAWKLRSDSRVVCVERTNFRYMKKEDLGIEFDFATADVSFISLSKILPAAGELLREGGTMVCLVKPQFEAGREKVGKKGVVRDPEVHKAVLTSCCQYAQNSGFAVKALSWSPIRGPEGNIEYLMCLSRGAEIQFDIAEETGKIVALSHSFIDGGK